MWELEVGDDVDYVIADEWDPTDHRIRLRRSVRATVVRINGHRVTVRLTDFPTWRMRTVDRTSWRLGGQ
jgi:hypothetical protein